MTNLGVTESILFSHTLSFQGRYLLLQGLKPLLRGQPIFREFLAQIGILQNGHTRSGSRLQAGESYLDSGVLVSWKSGSLENPDMSQLPGRNG